MSRPIRVVCGTRTARKEFSRRTPLGRSLSLVGRADAELQVFDRTSAGLPAIYNEAIQAAQRHPAILMFVHDDVHICDFFWADKVRAAIEAFDIVGLAGNRRRVARQPGWAFIDTDFTWDKPAFLSGVVGHGRGFPCTRVSVYGPPGRACKLLDGVMLVADSRRLIDTGLRFDPQFAFHFYDMDFCRQAERRGLSMGTWPISIVHESGGAYGTPAWRAAYRRYLRKYGGR